MWLTRLGLDAPVVAILFLATSTVFAVGADKLGFYSDDAGFLTSLPGDGLIATLRSASEYVPGRNLHIIWQQLFFVIGGHSPGDLGTLHVIQSCTDGIAVAVFYLLLRKLRVQLFWAVVGATAFAFYPNHGETHFWLSSGPMNVMSTLFLLAFAYATAAAMERTARTGQREPSWLIGLAFLFFGLALFTYDQTFFVLLFVLALRTGQLVKRRISPDLPLGIGGAGYLGAILLYAALKRNPQSGPTLTHISVSHVWSNVKLSVQTTFGSIFRNQTDFLLQSVSASDRAIAWTTGGGFVLVCAAVLGRELLVRAPEAPTRSSFQATGFKRSVALVAVGVSGFFLGYLPADMWFISPRHNFLPTAGLALAIAAAGSTLTTALSKYSHRFAPIGLAFAVAVVCAIFVTRFVEVGLSEKRYWQEAYQLRRNLYGQLMQKHLLTHRTAIVFQGFPATLGPAPYFGQENQLGLRYLYPGKVSLKASSISALQSTRGYYLYTEIARYGPVPARFLPTGSVADIVYHSETPSSVRFGTSSRSYSVARFYRVRQLAPTGTHRSGRAELRPAVLTTHGRNSTLTLDVAGSSLRLARGEELAAILFRKDGRPWTTTNPYGEAMILPIGLAAGPRLAPPTRYEVNLRNVKASAARMFVHVSLYVLSTDPATQIATANVIHH